MIMIVWLKGLEESMINYKNFKKMQDNLIRENYYLNQNKQIIVQYKQW